MLVDFIKFVTLVSYQLVNIFMSNSDGLGDHLQCHIHLFHFIILLCSHLINCAIMVATVPCQNTAHTKQYLT